MDTDKAEFAFTKILARLLKNIIEIAGDTFSLAMLEFQLFGKSLVTILVLLGCGMAFLLVFWLVASLTLVLGLISLHLDRLLALLLVGILNLLLLLLTVFFITRTKRQMKIAATRRQVASYASTYEKFKSHSVKPPEKNP